MIKKIEVEIKEDEEIKLSAIVSVKDQEKTPIIIKFTDENEFADGYSISIDNLQTAIKDWFDKRAGRK